MTTRGLSLGVDLRALPDRRYLVLIYDVNRIGCEEFEDLRWLVSYSEQGRG